MGAPQSQVCGSIFRNDLSVVTFLRGLLPAGTAIKKGSNLLVITFHVVIIVAFVSDDGREDMSWLCFVFSITAGWRYLLRLSNVTLVFRK